MFKTFNEMREERQELINEFYASGEFDFLNESEKIELYELLEEYKDVKVQDLDEGFFGKLMGGVTGLVVGPAIGKIVARTLGIDKGILYDMLTSKLVSTALGASIGNYITSKK